MAFSTFSVFNIQRSAEEVSADFFNHSVAFFAEAVMRNHDRSKARHAQPPS